MVGLCDSITKAWGEIEDCEQELLGNFFSFEILMILMNFYLFLLFLMKNRENSCSFRVRKGD